MAAEPGNINLETPDLAFANRLAFEQLFPGVLDDEVLDVGRLSELLDVPAAQVPDGRERYGLQWAGKQEAVRSLLTPSRATLIPDLENSIGFDTARNVFVEGDNLEVLKLLQKAYNDKFKLIYIDPPYNTGNDFVYNDDFSDGLRGYLEYTGQVDEGGNRISTNTETSGRRHSRWLSMMYPRLLLARNLLTQDGVIAVSIDSNEVHQLKLLLDELFGSENHVNTFVWVSNLKGRQISDGGAVGTHEYILVYGRNGDLVDQFRGSFSQLQALMPSVYKGGAYAVKQDAKGPYVTKNELYNTNSKFNEKTAPTMIFRIHYNPDSGEVNVSDVDDATEFPGFLTAMPHSNARPNVKWHAWRWSRAKILKDHEDLEFDTSGGRLRIRTKIRDVEGVALKDIIIGPSTVTGQADLDAVGLARVFDTPKPVSLLQLLVSVATGSDDLVLDFFAGSGTAAHAVALQNADDGGRRGSVAVNLPEPTNEDSDARRAGFETVSEITLARLRAVAEIIPGAQEAGLRAFTLGPGCFGQAHDDDGLFDMRESTRAAEAGDWEAIAAEVLLREGVQLDQRWDRKHLVGVRVVVSGGVAVVLSDHIDDALVQAALELKPRVLVFMEDGFAGADAVKANAVTNARNLGITLKTI
jgi:adenine-specific DNA-methyltransferase